LFIANTLQAIGGALNFHWINIGKVEVGSFCNVQGGYSQCIHQILVLFTDLLTGIIQTVGDTGFALSTIVSAEPHPSS
jgi:hypothetical protein